MVNQRRTADHINEVRRRVDPPTGCRAAAEPAKVKVTGGPSLLIPRRLTTGPRISPRARAAASPSDEPAGRTSTASPSQARPGQPFAISSASASDATSTTMKPPSTSFVSANGPSEMPLLRTVFAVRRPAELLAAADPAGHRRAPGTRPSSPRSRLPCPRPCRSATPRRAPGPGASAGCSASRVPPRGAADRRRSPGRRPRRPPGSTFLGSAFRQDRLDLGRGALLVERREHDRADRAVGPDEELASAGPRAGSGGRCRRSGRRRSCSRAGSRRRRRRRPRRSSPGR